MHRKVLPSKGRMIYAYQWWLKSEHSTTSMISSSALNDPLGDPGSCWTHLRNLFSTTAVSAPMITRSPSCRSCSNIWKTLTCEGPNTCRAQNHIGRVSGLVYTGYTSMPVSAKWHPWLACKTKCTSWFYTGNDLAHQYKTKGHFQSSSLSQHKPAGDFKQGNIK
jgi:hypothetical protein